jgi:hypothetical protein
MNRTKRIFDAVFALMVLLSISAATCSSSTTFAAEPIKKPNLHKGVWLSREEVQRLPTTGPAWEQLVAAASRDPGRPNVSDQDQMNNVDVLAKALVYVRTGAEPLRTEVRQQCLTAIGTEKGGRTLALGRECGAYVIAADLVKLEPGEDKRFREWLRLLLDEPLDGKTLRSTHEQRPNNWGTHAGGSRIAIAVYLNDAQELARSAAVFKGWLGDLSAYSGFKYGELDWQSDPAHPRGINPRSAVKQGYRVDGIIPDDMRRGGGFEFPPKSTNYPWGALEGACLQAEILSRHGYDAWNWEDQALRRAVQCLFDLDREYPNDGWWAEGDDTWMVWLVNSAYGTSFPTVLPARPGKNMAWTDWTHTRPGR